jgi:hypothetical protein
LQLIPVARAEIVNWAPLRASRDRVWAAVPGGALRVSFVGILLQFEKDF